MLKSTLVAVLFTQVLNSSLTIASDPVVDAEFEHEVASSVRSPFQLAGPA